MLQNVKLCGYKIPTPIQAYCLPSVFKGIDIIGIAQTGMEQVIPEATTTDSYRRIWEDSGIPNSDPLQAHGKGQEVGRSTP